MKKNKTIIFGLLVLFCLPIGFYLYVYSSAKNSTDCSQFVIDSYELYSGIDIPKTKGVVNCYYDDESKVRTSIYDLDQEVKLDKFKLVPTQDAIGELKGRHRFAQEEMPKTKSLYFATGSKKGASWTYIYDHASKRLWAELIG